MVALWLALGNPHIFPTPDIRSPEGNLHCYNLPPLEERRKRIQLWWTPKADLSVLRALKPPWKRPHLMLYSRILFYGCSGQPRHLAGILQFSTSLSGQATFVLLRS